MTAQILQFSLTDGSTHKCEFPPNTCRSAGNVLDVIANYLEFVEPIRDMNRGERPSTKEQRAKQWDHLGLKKVEILVGNNEPIPITRDLAVAEDDQGD